MQTFRSSAWAGSALMIALTMLMAAGGKFVEIFAMGVLLLGLLCSTRLLAHLTLLCAVVMPQSHELNQALLAWGKLHVSELLLALLLARVAARIALAAPVERHGRATVLSPSAAWWLGLIFISAYGALRNGVVPFAQDLRPMIGYAVAFPVMYLVRRDPGRFVREFLLITVAASIMVSIVSLGFFVLSDRIPYDLMPTLQDEGRVAMRNGAFVAFSLPLAAALWAGRVPLRYRLAALVVILTAVLQLAVSQNRSLILVAPIAALAGFLFVWRGSLARLIGMVATLVVFLSCAAAILVFTVPGILAGIANRFLALAGTDGLTDSSAIARVSMAYRAIEQLWAHPLLGLGVGHRLQVVFMDRTIADSYYIDNYWVVALVKLGVVGFVCLLYGMSRILKSAFQLKVERLGNVVPDAAVFLGMLKSAVLALAMLNFFNAGMWAHPTAIMPIAYMVGIGVALVGVAKEGDAFGRRADFASGSACGRSLGAPNGARA